MRESQPEDSIVAPTEGSEQATVASSDAALEAEDDEDDDEVFDAHLEHNFNGFEWRRLPKYIKPVTTHQRRAVSVSASSVR